VEPTTLWLPVNGVRGKKWDLSVTGVPSSGLATEGRWERREEGWQVRACLFA